jgi:hypothetical protein
VARVVSPALWIAVTNGYVRADQVIEIRHFKNRGSGPGSGCEVRVVLPVSEGADEDFGARERRFTRVGDEATAQAIAIDLVRFLHREHQAAGILELVDGRLTLRE